MQPILDRFSSFFCRVLQGTLPDNCHTPPESMELFRMPTVASNVALEFLTPEFFVGPGGGGVSATFMSVPEAAMDEYHRSVLLEHKVGGARQSPHMKSISKTPGEKQRTQYSFRLRILSANARHHAAALRSGRNAHDPGHSPPGLSAEAAALRVCLTTRTDEGDPRSSNPKIITRLTRRALQGEVGGS